MEKKQTSHILPAPALQSRAADTGSGTVIKPSAPGGVQGAFALQSSASSPSPQDNQAQLQTQMSTPMTADDNDLIEKEWVVRAKEIVSGTRQDPYQQNRSIMRLRADYLKKRYNKDVNIGKA